MRDQDERFCCSHGLIGLWKQQNEGEEMRKERKRKGKECKRYMEERECIR